MKEKCKEFQKLLIDVYYKEEKFHTDMGNHLENCAECREYWEQLNNLREHLSDQNFSIPVEYDKIHQIFQKAELLEMNRARKRSLVCFIIVACMILSFLTMMALRGFVMQMIYFQIFLYFILPVFLPILVKIRVLKEGSNESN